MILLLIFSCVQGSPYLAYAKDPTVNDPDLNVELVTDGLRFPTTMDFLDDNILVLEKDNGTVRRILDGQILSGHTQKYNHN